MPEIPAANVASGHDPRRLRFGLRAWLLVAAAALLVAAATLGVARWWEGWNTPRMPLSHGRMGGVVWTLSAQKEQGQLCMFLTTVPVTTQSGAGECGFTGHDGYPGEYFYWEPGPPGSEFMFGPVPSNVATVKVMSGVSVPARALPRRAGLPTGRYWVWVQPTTLPKSDGALYQTPKLYDRQGQSVPFTAFR